MPEQDQDLFHAPTAARAVNALRQAGFPLKVHNQYHVHVLTADGAKHNLWFTKAGYKFQRAGDRHAKEVSLPQLMAALRGFDAAATDLAAMHAVRELTHRVPIKQGIYADAGFRRKDGLARLAVVHLTGNDVDVHVRHVPAKNNEEAEDLAVRLALTLFPGDEPVYNDNANIVAKHPRAVWVPRKDNREADVVAHLRGPGRAALTLPSTPAPGDADGPASGAGAAAG